MNKAEAVKSQQSSAELRVDEVLGVNGSGASGVLGRAKWPVLLAFGLLCAGAAYYFLGAAAPTGNVQYRTDQARIADITVTVTATGTVEPTNQVDISSELSGIVRTVNVDYNSTVKKGQVLAELDTDKLTATVESSRARLEATKARVLEAQATVLEKQRELQRKRALADRAVGSRQELEIAQAAHDRALASLASAKADVKSAEADLKLNETNLQKSCICSPIDGVVLSRAVDPGQVVASSLQAPVLFSIAEDLSKIEVRVDVDEADVGKVREGQFATFTVDAYPERRFQANISQLRYGSEIVQGVVTYKAVLSTENADLLLRPGMTATAEIVVDEANQVLTVSNEALRFSAPAQHEETRNRSFLEQLIPGRPPFRRASRAQSTGPTRELWVLQDDGTLRSVEVTVGVTDGNRTQIVEGQIEPGQRIAVDVVAQAR